MGLKVFSKALSEDERICFDRLYMRYEEYVRVMADGKPKELEEQIPVLLACLQTFFEEMEK